MSEDVVVLTDANFDAEVTKSNMPVLVDFLGGVVRTMQTTGTRDRRTSKRIQREGQDWKT